MFSPRVRARIATLGAAAALACVPAAAMGQDGAGDDQYTDPFGETTQGEPTPTTIKPVPTPAPRRTAASPTTQGEEPAPTATTAATASVPAEEALADTGLDVRYLLLAGITLMVGGAALRLRLR